MFRGLILGVVVVVLACVSGVQAEVSIETVTVGDPGNVPDTRYETPGYGGVDYIYRLGKYEVTNSQYAEFLNAIAAVGDPNGLYSTEMGGGENDLGGISRTGSGTEGDPWVYAARSNRGTRPVNYVSWYDSLRFANWLHNGQPGLGTPAPQNENSTEDGAYDMSLQQDIVRKPGALVFMPSEDEWYKAAYYKGGGVDAGYWDYPTESDTCPATQPPPGTDLDNGSANYYSGVRCSADPDYCTTEVGAYNTQDSGVYVSDGPYGTFDQGGNVWEWNEVAIDDIGDIRGVRGGSFYAGYATLKAQDRFHHAAVETEHEEFGLRVASVFQPDGIPVVSEWGLVTMAALVLAAGGGVLARRRRLAVDR